MDLAEAIDEALFTWYKTNESFMTGYKQAVLHVNEEWPWNKGVNRWIDAPTSMFELGYQWGYLDSKAGRERAQRLWGE